MAIRTSHGRRSAEWRKRGKLASALPLLICWLSIAAVTGGLHFSQQTRGGWGGAFDPVGPLIAVAFPWMGSLVASRRPRDPTGWLLCSASLLGVAFFAEHYAAYAFSANPQLLPGATWMAWVGAWAWVPGVIVFRTLLVLLFPDGRPPSKAWRPVAVASVAVATVATVTAALAGGPLPDSSVANPVGITSIPASLPVSCTLLAVVVIGPLCLFALLLRYRDADTRARERLRWFVGAATAITAVPFLAFLVPPGLLPLAVYRGLGLVSAALLAAAMLHSLLRPEAAGLRVSEVRRFVDRSMVVAAVAVILGVAYWATVTYTDLNLLVLLGLLVVSAAPLWLALTVVLERVQSAFLARSTLVALAQRLDKAVATDQILLDIVSTVAGVLKLPYVAVEVWDDRREVIAVKLHGDMMPNAEAFDLVHGSEVVGRLVVATDTPEAGLRAGDRLLLEDLSSQLAVAAYALRQTAALERARQKLVTQREEDRARLRRDHHDGVKPAISGVICEIDAILNMCEAAGSTRPLEQITHQAASVKRKVARIRADLRRMIDNQGPRSVDELGLAGAVRLHVSTLGLGASPLVVVVRAPEELSGLPTDVEVGAFFIVSEAVENVRAHSGANRCIVAIGIADGHLQVEVSDDGHGLGQQLPQGIGMSSMAARAEDLQGELFAGSSPEGGTLIRVRIPLSLGTSS